METSMLKKPESVEYAAAHPFCIPLWVTVFAWLVQTFAAGGFWLVPLCFLLLWLASYLYSAPRLLRIMPRRKHTLYPLPSLPR